MLRNWLGVVARWKDERYHPERQSSSGKKRADKGALRMKNVYEVLRQKELEVSRLTREVEEIGH
jgi:hypothetical protein